MMHDGRKVKKEVNGAMVARLCRAIHNMALGVGCFNPEVGDLIRETADDFLEDHVFEPEKPRKTKKEQ